MPGPNRRTTANSLMPLLAATLLTLAGCVQTSVSPLPATAHGVNRVGQPIPKLDPSTPSSTFGPTTANVIGHSVNGQPISATEFGLGYSNPKRLYLIALIHGNEAEGFNAIKPVERALRAATNESELRVRLVPTMNPDGYAIGRRGNASGIDLNRNWPASNFSPSRYRGYAPASEPEVEAILADLESFKPDVLIVFHSSTRGPFVNFDGPPQTESLAQAFADAVNSAASRRANRWTVEPSMGYPTPGSLGTWAGVDHNIPTLTIEFRSGMDQTQATQAAVEGVRAVSKALDSGDAFGS